MRHLQMENTGYHNSRGISCHHGASNYPNVLKHAKTVVSRSPQINIVEIDFITYNREVISSHDYRVANVVQGSTLFEWIRDIIFVERRLLWIDVKENHVYMHSLCGTDSYTEKFDVSLFFDTLNQCRRHFKLFSQEEGIDISEFLVIGCQDEVLSTSLYMYNVSNCHDVYRMICDIPGANYYIWQAITPSLLQPLLLNNYVRSEYTNFNFIERSHGWVAIDMNFFNTRGDLISFIEQSSIPRNANIILYNAVEHEPYLNVSTGHHIIMQYDFPI